MHGPATLTGGSRPSDEVIPRPRAPVIDSFRDFDRPSNTAERYIRGPPVHLLAPQTPACAVALHVAMTERPRGTVHRTRVRQDLSS